MSKIDDARAQEIIARATAMAGQLGVSICIAVVDDGAHLKAFLRMDGAFPGAVDVAQGKARTSALFPMESGDFGRMIAGERLLGMAQSNGGLMGFDGGVPVLDGAVQVGAVGVSGATAEQDRQIARYAAGEDT